jgi:hypothetical protein
VTGSLDTPNPQTATVELFISPGADPSGFGEGRVFRTAVTPNDAGNFTAVLRTGITGFVTATATDAAGNSSEFSAAVAITRDPRATRRSTPATSSWSNSTLAAGRLDLRCRTSARHGRCAEASGHR